MARPDKGVIVSVLLTPEKRINANPHCPDLQREPPEERQKLVEWYQDAIQYHTNCQQQHEAEAKAAGEWAAELKEELKKIQA